MSDTDNNLREEREKTLQRIFERVLRRILPSEEEDSRIGEIISLIESYALSFKKEQGVDFDIVHVGSTAKDTHLNTGDIDLFFRFPLEVSEEKMKEVIFSIGKEVLESYEIRYAEHPYIKGILRGVKVDIVPCYDVKSGADIISAVDRTPFHTQYITSHLSVEQRNEVRLLKQFVSGIGCYGSENSRMGFSGYLTELLIIYYGDFLSVLHAAAEWKRGTVIDLKGEGFSGADEERKRPLLVIDPVDKARNVASPVSDRNIALFIHASRDFLSNPSIRFFFPRPLKTWNMEQIEKEISQRGRMVFIVFERGEVLDDILYPQLRMAEGRLKRTLEEKGFLLNNHGFVVVEGKVYLYLEFKVWKIPNRVLHVGPMVYISEHEKRFLKKWRKKGMIPFLKGDRWYVYAPVSYRTPQDFLRKELNRMELGRHIKSLISKGFTLFEAKDMNRDVLTLILDGRMPWER